jgi:hypothetical protein
MSHWKSLAVFDDATEDRNLWVRTGSITKGESMIHHIATVVLLGCVLAGPSAAQEPGSASGKGRIEHLVAADKSEMLNFSPRYSYAYPAVIAKMKFTWLVLTEKEPPLKEWTVAKDPAAARRLWCEKEKTPFVAVQLDAQWKVYAYYLCPSNGVVNTEMLNTVNGLDSVALKFATRDAKRLKGTLRTGEGSCPGPDGKEAYCTPTGDYTFDAPVFK